jgi:hypothetical protein
MSDSGPVSGGVGRKAGPPPFSPRSRARRLYRARRGRLLEVPVAAMRKRFGHNQVVVDDADARFARTTHRDATIEVGFAGVFRMFGALIDTQWVGVIGSVDDKDDRLLYRFDKRAFVVKRGADAGLAGRLGDSETVKLAGRSELKSIEIIDGPNGRRVVITPIPGTITAVYFPPMPPYSVPIKPHEADDHIELVLHLLRS